MDVLVHLIASEGHSSGGGASMVPFVLIGGGVVAAVLMQRSRLQKAKARVNVHRVHDAGAWDLTRYPIRTRSRSLPKPVPLTS